MIHCLHGAVGHANDWNIFKDTLGQETKAHDLWAFLKNHPPSLPEAGEIISQQAAQNDILLGYSMGGRLALHALLSTPHKFHAAIIISAHPGLLTGQPERLAHDEKWATLAHQDWPTFLTQWNQQSILPTIPQGFHQAGSKDQLSVAQSFQTWSLGAQLNLRPQLKNITCPTLWITGEDDQKFTSLAAEAATLSPLASHTTVPDCGHRVPWQKPETFSETVRNFLSENKPS